MLGGQHGFEEEGPQKRTWLSLVHPPEFRIRKQTSNEGSEQGALMDRSVVKADQSGLNIDFPEFTFCGEPLMLRSLKNLNNRGSADDTELF